MISYFRGKNNKNGFTFLVGQGLDALMNDCLEPSNNADIYYILWERNAKIDQHSELLIYTYVLIDYTNSVKFWCFLNLTGPDILSKIQIPYGISLIALNGTSLPYMRRLLEKNVNTSGGGLLEIIEEQFSCHEIISNHVERLKVRFY